MNFDVTQVRKDFPILNNQKLSTKDDMKDITLT